MGPCTPPILASKRALSALLTASRHHQKLFLSDPRKAREKKTRAHDLLLRLHGGEEDDLSDAIVISQEHREAVYAATPAARGRQTVFQGSHKVVVHTLSLLVASILGCSLAHEAGKLPLGIIQLGVRIAQLLAKHEHLETLSHTRLLPVPLRQGTHDLRMLRDEGGIDDPVLDVVTTQLVE